MATISMICCTPNHKNELSIEAVQGDWVGGINSNLEVSITADSFYWSLKDKFTIAQSYEYKIVEDSIFLISKNGMIDKLLLMSENDKLVCCNFKSHIDSGRIDEVTVLCKTKNVPVSLQNLSQNKEFKKDIFIIPENQIGIFLVAFQQKDGNEVAFDELGNRVFTFEKGSNILYSQSKEDIKKLALNQFEVYQKTESGELKPYPVLHKIELNEELQETELVAIIEGFNQGGRKKLNKLVDKDISGNVLWFNIGTEVAISNINDSLFHNGRYYKMDYRGRWIK